MAKFYGKIGFGKTVETEPGVFEEEFTSRNYYGDTIRNSRMLQSSDSINDNINIANQISILADPFAKDNFHTIRYAEYMGTKWKVTTAEVLFPRILLTLGGVYNG